MTISCKNDTTFYVVQDVLKNGIVKSFGRVEGNMVLVYDEDGVWPVNFYHIDNCRFRLSDAIEYAERKRREEVKKLERKIERLKELKFA